MSFAQPGILEPRPDCSRYLFFALRPEAATQTLRARLERLADGDRLVVGLGSSLVEHLGGTIEPLRPFPAQSHRGIDIPSTPFALWCWLRGEDRGELLHRGRMIERQLNEDLSLELAIEGFRFGPGLDLTGDGEDLENPEGEEAVLAAITHLPERLAGSSFVAVQQWQHDLDSFDALSDRAPEAPDEPAAPRAPAPKQEDFAPERLMLRRSQPWIEGRRAGLVFIAFGQSLDAFEARLRCLIGLEDHLPASLFRYSRPLSGSYYWCPPLHQGRLDLSALDP
ncbi:Dyp-type peroxidase domain-containing protein [Motiliproteus sp. SC1-56]|uniref:Dyp-type peroxidase n=1 Tax=Motiliproteus sp. SC1-56 TaxID=2799565 RepID=UPI001A8CAB4D|nr:Dyp-type peroxidase domain-containing protein [Motiliproteus sp. SC1-56]